MPCPWHKAPTGWLGAGYDWVTFSCDVLRVWSGATPITLNDSGEQLRRTFFVGMLVTRRTLFGWISAFGNTKHLQTYNWIFPT